MNRSAVLALCLIAPFVPSTLALSYTPHHAKAKPVSSVKFVDQLDKLVQPRFQVSAGIFGMDRISFHGHEPISEPEEVKSFKRMLKGTSTLAKTTYSVGFFHCIDKPGQMMNKDKDEQEEPYKKHLNEYYSELYLVEKGKVIDEDEDPRTNIYGVPDYKQVNEFCAKNLDKLTHGKSVDGQIKNWDIALRPVKAEHESCVNCHEGAKPGDTLGVMVYALKQQK